MQETHIPYALRPSRAVASTTTTTATNDAKLQFAEDSARPWDGLMRTFPDHILRPVGPLWGDGVLVFALPLHIMWENEHIPQAEKDAAPDPHQYPQQAGSIALYPTHGVWRLLKTPVDETDTNDAAPLSAATQSVKLAVDGDHLVCNRTVSHQHLRVWRMNVEENQVYWATDCLSCFDAVMMPDRQVLAVGVFQWHILDGTTGQVLAIVPFGLTFYRVEVHVPTCQLVCMNVFGGVHVLGLDRNTGNVAHIQSLFDTQELSDGPAMHGISTLLLDSQGHVLLLSAEATSPKVRVQSAHLPSLTSNSSSGSVCPHPRAPRSTTTTTTVTDHRMLLQSAYFRPILFGGSFCGTHTSGNSHLLLFFPVQPELTTWC